MIGLIPLEPYWLGGVLLVSQGESTKGIVDWLDKAMEPLKENNPKEYRRRKRVWRKLVMDKCVIKGVLKVNDPNNITSGSVYYETNGDSPCMIMILSPKFDSSNHTNMVTLAHECLHVCQRLLPIYLNRDEEHEAEAYFHSYLMLKIVEMLEE